MKSVQKLILTVKHHRKRKVIFLDFTYNTDWIDMAKSIGCFWSDTNKKWYLPNTKYHLEKIYQVFNPVAQIKGIDLKQAPVKPDIDVLPIVKKTRQKVFAKDLSSLDIENIHRYVKYLRGKSLSESTVRTYYTHILDFLKYLKGKPLEEICNRDIERFIEDVCIPRKYAISTHRQVIGAMKHFNNLFTDCSIDPAQLELPRKNRYLPTVLSKEEVIALLRGTKNLKHRAILGMIYASGLRIGELLSLELKDIDINRYQIFIKNSKGRKDRYVMLARSLMPLINNYVMSYKPEKYFVEGKEPGTVYSAGSIRNFLKRSCQAAGIIKRVTPHTLRHCYATHMLENGVDLRYIQELLGHSKPETTMIYTHVATKDLAAIESPLDKIAKDITRSEKNKQNLELPGKENI